ncbi:cell division protein CrgA [Micromonospora sp. NPDC048830]|uniref:cell division protein CrgA n=1 Tax=Micromonospora sp. NPDC048830 TaxID=3364257 RepID=UPI00371951AE
MTTDRDEEVIAAYAAGEDVGHMAWRLGIPADEIRRIVVRETGGGARPAGGPPGAVRPGWTPLAVAGIVLVVLGLVGGLAGVLWLAVYYLSGAEYPVSSLGQGNVAVGVGGSCAGSVPMLIGMVLLLVARTRRG